MIRVLYFADCAGDVAVTMSEIIFFLAFLGFWGLMDFKQTIKFKD